MGGSGVLLPPYSLVPLEMQILPNDFKSYLYHGERRYVNINMFPIPVSDSMFLVGHNKDVHVLVLIEIILNMT